MNIEYTIQPIFASSFVVFKNLNLNNKQILKELEELSYETIETDNIKNKSQSSKSIKILNEIKSGKQIKEKIDSCVQKAVKNIWKYNTNHTIVNSWATKTCYGEESDFHTHKNFWLSAVYYPFSTGEFRIRFQSDRFDLTSYDVNVLEYNFFNCTSWDHVVSSGDLIIFSAALKHKILVNKTQNIRYSIAMNILPKGNIGGGDGFLTLE